LEQFREELVATIRQEALAADLQPEAGQKLQALDTDGRSARLTVWDVSEQTVTIDTHRGVRAPNIL
jgi:FKBP-type peptidyl-prolyl cis-trans isomerase 2